MIMEYNKGTIWRLRHVSETTARHMFGICHYKLAAAAAAAARKGIITQLKSYLKHHHHTLQGL